MMVWMFRHVLLPACIFYVIAGLLFQKNVFDSLFLGLLVFVYSNFVPDWDSLLVVAANKPEGYYPFEKLCLLFFGPLFVYYVVSEEAKPIYAKRPKEFHSLRGLLLYTTFLLIVGLVFYRNGLEQISLPFFGCLGYATHLAVDGCLKLR